MRATAPPRFVLAAVGTRAALVSLLLILALLLGLHLAMALLIDGSPSALVLPAATTTGITALVWLAVIVGSRRRDITLTDAGLTVRAALYRRTVPLASLDLAQARVIDREEHPELRPRFKRNGIAIPGVYRSGTFTLRNRQRAFVVVGSGRWRLWLPSSREALLLEVDDPRGLLAALRARAGLAAAGGNR